MLGGTSDNIPSVGGDRQHMHNITTGLPRKWAPPCAAGHPYVGATLSRAEHGLIRQHLLAKLPPEPVSGGAELLERAVPAGALSQRRDADRLK